MKLFHTTEEGVVRLVSVLSPFLFVVVRLIFGAPFGPDTFIFDIAVATAIILLSPWGEDDIFSLLIIALSTSALGMVGAGLSRVLPCETLALGYAIAVSLPIMVRFALKVYTMLDDKEFLLSQASGWELASTFLNVGIAMSVLCSVMVALCLVAVGAGKVWLYIQAVVSVSLYVFLVVRSLTRRPVLLGSISDKAFRRRLKMSLSFMPPEVPGRYKRLYKAMCLMLEDEKKFLDENYSMDDMSRDLCTNRGQLSKMITVYERPFPARFRAGQPVRVRQQSLLRNGFQAVYEHHPRRVVRPVSDFKGDEPCQGQIFQACGTEAETSSWECLTGCSKRMFLAIRLMLPSGFERGAPYLRSPLMGHPMPESWQRIWW